MKSIILIGYMGAGKTTVGKALAKELDKKFYDLDWYIEDRFHKKISEIFQESGEEGFRTIEKNMLREVAEFEDIILACGGGTPCFHQNMEYMNQTGTTIYLKASPDIIIQHLQLSKTVRPLLQNKTGQELYNYINDQLSQREIFYKQANHIVNVNVLDNYDRIHIIVSQLKQIIHEADKIKDGEQIH